MPVVINNGGDVKLPMCVLKKGATLVDQGAWASARRHPGVEAMLSTGRLQIAKKEFREAPPPPSSPEAPQPEAAAPENIAAPADLSTMNAKTAAKAVSELSLDEVVSYLETEERGTVIQALERRRDKLEAE